MEQQPWRWLESVLLRTCAPPEGHAAKPDAPLAKLEMQIRDGLHVFGHAPDGDALADLLWPPPAPAARRRAASGVAAARACCAISASPSIRSIAISRRLAGRAARCAGGRAPGAPRATRWSGWRFSPPRCCAARGARAALGAHRRRARWFEGDAAAGVLASGQAEMAGLLRGLDGRFVPPGPRARRRAAGPTCCRRAAISFARHPRRADAGRVAARLEIGQLLIERHAQEHGDYPRRVALSAWGTANMRTGGDDVAQALALMGVRPQWEPRAAASPASRSCRPSVLDRPRVDVTLARLGLFPRRLSEPHRPRRQRRARLAALDEADDVNPLAARSRPTARASKPRACRRAEAARRAGYRVFGSKPGAYGAGLQALIDERCWETTPISPTHISPGAAMPMARARRACAEEALFRDRLGAVEAVLHNQDNREHDILDSDDYYQFEGGLAVDGAPSHGRAADRLSQRPFAARTAAHPHARGGGRPRRPCARRQSEMDRGRDAPRLQGRLRAGGDGRLSLCLCRHRARRARPSFRRRL